MFKFELDRGQDDLEERVRDVFDRDAKHALNSPDPEERLLGIRASETFLYE